MQQQAAAAYQQTAKKTANPRELEASLLSKSAAQLQRIKDDWDNKKKRAWRCPHLQSQALDCIFDVSNKRRKSVANCHQAKCGKLGYFCDESNHHSACTPCARETVCAHQYKPRTCSRSSHTDGASRWINSNFHQINKRRDHFGSSPFFYCQNEFINNYWT